MMWLFRSVFVFGIVLFAASSPASAQLLSGSMTIPSRADQMIRLFPGSPLNPSAGIVEVPTSAVGQFALTWAPQQPGDNFATVTGFTAHFASGPSDPLGLYTIDAPATSSNFQGRLTEIVESGGILISAKLTLETTFGVTLAALGGASVFTINDPASAALEDHYSAFIGTLHGSANSTDIFDSPANKNIYTNVPGVGQVPVGQSFNRQVIAVPEPSATAMLLIGALGLVRCRRSIASK